MPREKSRREERFFASLPVFRPKKKKSETEGEAKAVDEDLVRMINGLMPVPPNYTYTYTSPNSGPYIMGGISFGLTSGQTVSLANGSVQEVQRIDKETIDLAKLQQRIIMESLEETHTQIIGLLTAATSAMLRAFQMNTNANPVVIERLKRMISALEQLRFFENTPPQIEEAIKKILDDGGEHEQGSREQIQANVIGIETAMRPLLLQLALSGGRCEREW